MGRRRGALLPALIPLAVALLLAPAAGRTEEPAAPPPAAASEVAPAPSPALSAAPTADTPAPAAGAATPSPAAPDAQAPPRPADLPATQAPSAVPAPEPASPEPAPAPAPSPSPPPAPEPAPLLTPSVPETEGATAPSPLIREIAVAGARMVEEATVRARIGSREGAPYDPEQVSRDVRALFELGSFENVTVDAEGFEGGMRLTYRVVERPLLRSVEFEGNKEVDAKDLREKAALALNAPYNPVGVAAAVERMRALYREKGYYQAIVRTSVEPAGEGQARLKMVIEEGSKYKLVRIELTGVKAVPEKTLLGQMKSAPWTIFSWISGSGKLQHEVLQEDRQRLVSYYQDRGFLEVRVGEPEITVDDTAQTVRVVVPVTEGLQYRLGPTTLQGDDLVPLAEIRQFVGIREGEVFRRSAFAQGLSAVSQRYAARGYAFVKVDYLTKLDPAAQTIAVTFLVERGELARFGRVNVIGNITTRDRVIRRECTFAEGDIFNGEALRRSRQKINNLGFFETVDIVPHQREDNRIDVDIAVKEKLTGMIQFGLGYSTEDKLSGQIRVSESNLFGRGHSLTLMLEYSSVRQNYSVTFNEPAVFDGPWSAGFSIYNTMHEYDEYDRKAVGWRLNGGRSLGEYLRGYLALKHETVTVSDVKDSASQYIKDQVGTATTNSLRLSMVRDTRDNYMNPTRGSRTSLSAEYAGGLFGGDNYFTKFEAEQSFYTPLLWRLVGMLHGEYGTVSGFDDREVPIYEKYFLGGITTLRGFQYREVGPKDENGDPKGGVKELFFNAEIILPVAPEQGLSIVTFYDTGNAWDVGQQPDLGDLRQSAGFGVRWMSPLGPFRLEWGWILDRQEGEPKGDWAFMIGNFF